MLKATCEAFIMHVTKLTVEPMLSFLTKVTAAKVAQQQQQEGGGGPKPLREQVRALMPAQLLEQERVRVSAPPRKFYQLAAGVRPATTPHPKKQRMLVAAGQLLALGAQGQPQPHPVPVGWEQHQAAWDQQAAGVARLYSISNSENRAVSGDVGSHDCSI